MRKFIQKSIIFIITLPIAMVLFIIVWGHIAPKFIHDNIYFLLGSDSFLYQRVRQVPDYGKTEVLVLGASHAYRGIDPRVFAQKDITLFNLGSSSQTPLQTKMLLKEKLHYLNPEVVLYEVYPEVFCMDGVESSLDVLANDYITKSTLAMCFEVHHLKTYLTLIYNGYRQLFKLDQNKIIPNKMDKDTYIPGGFVEKEYAEFVEPTSFDSITWEINPKQIEAFDNIIETLKNKNIELILVEAPITQYEKNRITNYTLLDSYLESKKLTYFNFNNNSAYPNNLFYDSNHLNQKGVNIFSAELLINLEKLLILE